MKELNEEFLLTLFSKNFSHTYILRLICIFMLLSCFRNKWTVRKFITKVERKPKNIFQASDWHSIGWMLTHVKINPYIKRAVGVMSPYSIIFSNGLNFKLWKSR